MKNIIRWGGAVFIGVLIIIAVWRAAGPKDPLTQSDTTGQELQTAIDQSEQKEKDRLNQFFSDLEKVYGYLYSVENGSFQLFIKIDEALREGELTGSLLLMAETGNENNPYEETSYVLNGITDGHMLEFFTTVNGKTVKLEGDFHEGAAGFDVTFWKTDEKLSFHAVTKEEFHESYKKFKIKAQQ